MFCRLLINLVYFIKELFVQYVSLLSDYLIDKMLNWCLSYEFYTIVGEPGTQSYLQNQADCLGHNTLSVPT